MFFDSVEKVYVGGIEVGGKLFCVSLKVVAWNF